MFEVVHDEWSDTYSIEAGNDVLDKDGNIRINYDFRPNIHHWRTCWEAQSFLDAWRESDFIPQIIDED